jgi:hypothetical protein
MARSRSGCQRARLDLGHRACASQFHLFMHQRTLLSTYGLPAVMYSVIGRGCEMATMFCTSKLASPSSASEGGCGSAVAPSSGLTRTTEKLKNHVRGRYIEDI